MLKLEGTILKYQPFTSKKNKELVSLTVFGKNKEVYEALASLKDVAHVSEGEVVTFDVNALPGTKVTLFVNGVV